MSKALSNKVALITGSSRGIGRAAALALAKEGASLIGVHYASNADAAHSTVREIEALGAKAVAIEADLKKGKEATDNIWQQFKTAVIATTGEPWLDILVNNAGVAPTLCLAQTSQSMIVVLGISGGVQGLSKMIDRARLAMLSRIIPDPPFSTPRHSHSIVLSDRNALNSVHKFFPHTMKNRLPDPSEICALEFKGEFRRFKICSVSATIGIDWSIFDIL